MKKNNIKLSFLFFALFFLFFSFIKNSQAGCSESGNHDENYTCSYSNTDNCSEFDSKYKKWEIYSQDNDKCKTYRKQPSVCCYLSYNRNDCEDGGEGICTDWLGGKEPEEICEYGELSQYKDFCSTGEYCCKKKGSSSPTPSTIKENKSGISVSENDATISFANPLGSENSEITSFFENILSYMQGIIAYLALILILIAGVIYLFAGMNPKAVTTAKVCFVSALIGFAIAAAAPTFLKEIKNIALGEGGSMPTTLDSALTLKQIIINAVSFILSIFGTLAIISLIIGGVLLLSSSASTEQKQTAKNTVVYSIIGIAVAGSAIILLKTIATMITG